MGTWTQLAPLPAARYQAASCWHDGKAYTFGGLPDNGVYGGGYLNTLFIYDPVGNTWTTGAVLPATGLCYAFSTTADGVHIVFPGTGAHYAYDPTTNTWATRTTAPGAGRIRAHHFLDSTGRFYLAGGQNASSYVVTVTRYHPDTDSWTSRADMPSAFSNGVTTTISPGVLGSDSKIYLGYGTLLTDLIVYDPTADTWARTTAMPADSQNGIEPGVARLPSGVVLALPRLRSPGGFQARVDGYDPATGTWTMGATPDFPGLSYRTSVATEPGGVIYLVGGLVGDPSSATAAVYAYKQNEPPTVATLLTMTGGVLVSTAATNRARHQFNDPNAGDSQSKFDWQYRLVGAPTWTTGTVISPNPWHDITAGTLTPGNYERQVLTYDAAGEPAPAWTPSGFFTAADPPAGPSITYPINGQLLDQIERVDWSTPAQGDGYQVRRVADNGAGTAVVNPVGADVYFDTGEVVDTLARTLPLEFTVNNRTEHVQVRVKDGGLWSDWVSVSGDVSYTEPPTPTVTVYPDEATGSLLLMITTPEPAPGAPAAVSVRVFIDDGQGEERKAVDLPPTTSWRYWTPASGRDYANAIRVESVAANGTTASS